MEVVFDQLLPEAARFHYTQRLGEVSLLTPEEASFVARAVPKRQREFAAGRHCAREALRALGIAEATIPVGAHREPLLPPGVVGSITHCDGLCAAAVAPMQSLAGLGLDAECELAVDESLLSSLATEHERAWLKDQPEVMRTALFSAKESIYKCMFHQWRRVVDFLEVELEPVASGQFAARSSFCDLRRTVVNYRWTSGYVITAAYVVSRA